MFTEKKIYFQEAIKDWNAEYLSPKKEIWTRRILPTI